MCEYNFYCIIYLYHSSVDGHLSCFLILAIVYNAVLNISVYISFWIISVFGFSRYIPRSKTTGSYYKFISSHFLRCRHTIFHNDCTSLHSHHQWLGFPFSTFSTFIICCLFDSKLHRCEMISHCSFDVHLTMMLNIMLLLFHIYMWNISLLFIVQAKIYRWLIRPVPGMDFPGG